MCIRDRFIPFAYLTVIARLKILKGSEFKLLPKFSAIMLLLALLFLTAASTAEFLKCVNPLRLFYAWVYSVL